MNEARKPRLTVQLLDDLAVAASVLEDEAGYLADAIKQHQGNPSLAERLTAKHRSVTRSHDWLTRHTAAVREQRSDDTTTD